MASSASTTAPMMTTVGRRFFLVSSRAAAAAALPLSAGATGLLASGFTPSGPPPPWPCRSARFPSGERSAASTSSTAIGRAPLNHQIHQLCPLAWCPAPDITVPDGSVRDKGCPHPEHLQVTLRNTL